MYKQLRSKLSTISQLQSEIELLKGDSKDVDVKYEEMFGQLSGNDALVLEVLKYHEQNSSKNDWNPKENIIPEDGNENQEDSSHKTCDLQRLVSILEYLLGVRLEFDENYNGRQEPENTAENPEEEEEQQEGRKEALVAKEIEYYAQSNQNDINLNKIFELQILNKRAITSINEKLKQINALQRQLNAKGLESPDIDRTDSVSLKRVRVRSAVLLELITFMITSSGHNWTRDQKLSEMIQYCGNQYTMDSEI